MNIIFASTNLTNPYTWSEGQCIMVGLLGFVALFLGILFLIACFCAGVRFLRELFRI